MNLILSNLEKSFGLKCDIIKSFNVLKWFFLQMSDVISTTGLHLAVETTRSYSDFIRMISRNRGVDICSV